MLEAVSASGFRGRRLEDETGAFPSSGLRTRVRVDFVSPTRVQHDFRVSHEVPPPYDGCQIGGLYGHRWNDQYGARTAVEIPLTPCGRVFFEDRAAGRDLAYFVRSDRVQRVRLSHKPLPLLRAFVRRYPGRVIELHAATALPPKGAVGFWIGARRLFFAETTPLGRRLYVVAKRGSLKLLDHNLGDLAFVF